MAAYMAAYLWQYLLPSHRVAAMRLILTHTSHPCLVHLPRLEGALLWCTKHGWLLAGKCKVATEQICGL